MKWMAIVVVALICIVALAALVGSQLPQAHRASREARFRVPPEAVWAAITDVEAFPSWRADVKRVQRLPDRDGRPVWVEESGRRKMTMMLERAEPPHLLVGRIADPDLPFGGTWTYDIKPAPGGSTLTITENGEIYNPIFRFMARFVFGYEGTMTGYLESLGRKLS